MFKKTAFSLIELLVVLAIVAIIATFSYPSYERYIVRSKVGELLEMGTQYRLQVFEQSLDHDPNERYEYDVDSKYVARVIVQWAAHNPRKQVVHVIAKMLTNTQRGIGITAADAGPLVLQLHGEEGANGVVDWSCHSMAEYLEYVPHQCKSTAMEAVSLS